MKKILLPILSLSICAIYIVSVTSCTRDINDQFQYKSELDTIEPEINISVPANNQSFAYGNHVAIVGTVIDLESEKNDIHVDEYRKGELTSVTINVDDLTHGSKLLKRDLNVAGQDGIGFNERIEIISGTGVTECRCIIVAKDGADPVHTVRDTVDFMYQ